MELGLTKGPWSQQEDEIVKEYVRIHGPKNWNAVQKLTGLPRDGRSCRFRWFNHLNPNLKKEKFSEEEKQKILHLRHLGYQWYKIAEQIPGRTDNEIKNFWNINERKKRKMENSNEEYRKKKKQINYLSLNVDEILKQLQDNKLNDNGESSNQQRDISHKHETEELMKDSFNIPIMQPSNMICNNVASTSTSNNSTPTFIDRGKAPFMPLVMVSNLPPSSESLNFPPYKSPLHSHTSINKNSSPTIIDRGEAPFMPMDMLSDLPPLSESPFHSHTSISKNSSPIIIDRGEAPFIPIDMVSDLPPLLQTIDVQSFESPLHSNTSISNKSSSTCINRGETSKDMKSTLPSFPESINFQYLESQLIDKYPPLPLRSPEEIRQEQLEPAVEDPNASYMHFCETRLVGETGSPEEIRQQQLEPAVEDPNANYMHFCETILLDDDESPEDIRQEQLELAMEDLLITCISGRQQQLEPAVKEYNPSCMQFCETILLDDDESPEDIRQEQLEPAILEDSIANYMHFLLVRESGSPEEIRQQQLEPAVEEYNPSYMQLCETRLVDESGKKPISLENNESRSEDLIDVFDSLGWLDGYIF